MQVDVIKTKNLVAHDTVVDLTGQPSFEEWKEFGLKLMAAEKYVQWYLGWWWNNGHDKWGREPEAFIEKCGYKQETLKVYGSIYNAVKPLIRINDLDFNHHRIIAPLPPAEQKTWLRKCLPKDEKKWTVAVLRKAIQGKKPTLPLPEGVFDVIYADPPWEYSNAGLGGAAEKHYPTMATEKICEMGICGVAAENAVLFLWATNPLLTDALQVMKAWGFTYKTNFCWVKVGRETYGKLGFYVSGAHELLLLGTRGSMLPDDEKPSSVITEPKSKHSQKPESVYGIIEQMYGNGKRLELFARNAKPRKSWTYWGDEA
ncbi:hypothetical protein LCGC14_2050690 [marine sediment metagenome]|uniref:Uncharacterized protein n=1 Tax=marine sediment metagenome TaxID=412755 RepID=A0A0F9EP43_9ZZZZ